MATNVQPDETGTVRRRQTDTTVRDMQAPMAIMSYNKWMGGVDRGDQPRQYYHLCLKSHKVYKYIFWFLMDVSIANSFVLHQHNTSTSTFTPFKAFRLELGKGLIGGYNSRKRAAPSAAPVVPRPRRLTSVAHFPLRQSTQGCQNYFAIYPSTRLESLNIDTSKNPQKVRGCF